MAARAAALASLPPPPSVPPLDGGTEVMAQGAEAVVYAVEAKKWLATEEKGIVVKRRFVRSYRHKGLDTRLTKGRLTGEARCLLKARKLGVKVPAVYHVDMDGLALYMERMQGPTLKATLAEAGGKRAAGLLVALGEAVANLHEGNVVHGDLTPSNVVVSDAGSVALIDFGLAQTSTLSEDKAVDLYVLERAINSTHDEGASGDDTAPFDHVLAGYERRASKGSWTAVSTKLAEVRSRGRKRTMVG